MTVALALPELWLGDTLTELVTTLQTRLNGFQPSNMLKASYYDLKTALKDMGIAIPPMLRNMTCVIGWPATAVDVLEERLDLQGWADPDEEFDLATHFAENHLDIEASFAHLDALIYGCAFVAVSTGQDDEPNPLITIESPTTMTALTSPRSRRVTAALAVDPDADTGTLTDCTLYLPEGTYTLHGGTGKWYIEDLDDHNLGRVPIAQLVNRARAGNMNGRSEITPAVRYYTDMAMRTMAASEVGREFFASPQRYVLGAPEKFMFREETHTDKETGETTTTLEPRSAWESYLGRILAIERDETDQVPTVGEFKANSLGPYWDTIRAVSQLLSAESSIPQHYLGFTTDNPTSADAIRQSEARLVKRVERRMKTFGRAWINVAELVLLVRDGAVPDDFETVAPQWGNAATPTRAADADRIQKLIAAGVLQPDSPVTWNELGFSPEVQRQLTIEKQQREVEEMMAALQQAAAAGAQAQPGVTALVAPPGAPGGPSGGGGTMAAPPPEAHP